MTDTKNDGPVYDWKLYPATPDASAIHCQGQQVESSVDGKELLILDSEGLVLRAPRAMFVAVVRGKRVVPDSREIPSAPVVGELRAYAQDLRRLTSYIESLPA